MNSEAPDVRPITTTRPEDQPETTQLSNLRTLYVGEGEGPPSLVTLAGDKVGAKISIDSMVIIGRSGDSKVKVPDPRVSRHHARIYRDDSGDFYIEDMESRNGTLINGVARSRHKLVFGDKIQVGSAAVFLFTHHDPLDVQVTRRQRLELLGRLGAGIIHDLNNMLGVAVASLQHVLALPSNTTIGDGEVRECLDDIMIAHEQSAELTSRLLGVARQGGFERTSVDIGQLCQEVCQLCRRTFPRSIELDFDGEPGLRVDGNRGQLSHLFMNLCVNARDAMPKGGKLAITVRRAEAVEVPGARSVKPHVMIIVSDNGVGMDEATRGKAFEPFFSNRDSAEGTGLGLAIVADVVRHHRGVVSLDSERGVGTSFRILLPEGEAPVDDDGPTNVEQVEEPVSSGTRVLLVDDDSAVRRSLKRVLKRHGYTVACARDGLEALSAFKIDPPDVVLLDLDMPGLTGQETLRRLRAVDPEIKAVFISGHWDGAVAAGEVSYAGDRVPFLQKPCDPSFLKSTLEKVLEARVSRRTIQT